MATQSSILQQYVPRPLTQLEGGEARYLKNELKRASVAINLLVQVVQEIDARLIAHGI